MPAAAIKAVAGIENFPSIYNTSVFQCFHIFHVTYYHECDLECNGIFKNAEIKTCTLLEFIEAVDQSVSVDVKLSGCL